MASFTAKQDEGMGDSIACVVASELAKVHMHTNDPSLLFDHAQTFSAGDEFLFFLSSFSRTLCQIAVLPPEGEHRSAIVPLVCGIPEKVAKIDYF